MTARIFIQVSTYETSKLGNLLFQSNGDPEKSNIHCDQIYGNKLSAPPIFENISWIKHQITSRLNPRRQLYLQSFKGDTRHPILGNSPRRMSKAPTCFTDKVDYIDYIYTWSTSCLEFSSSFRNVCEVLKVSCEFASFSNNLQICTAWMGFEN